MGSFEISELSYKASSTIHSCILKLTMISGRVYFTFTSDFATEGTLSVENRLKIDQVINV